MQDSGRLFHCVTVYGKKKYLYVSFEVNMCLKVCLYILLALESADMNHSSIQNVFQFFHVLFKISIKTVTMQNKIYKFELNIK